ncbi:hypothetical protein ACLKA6_003421 [Drosophila palustris]
MSPGRISQARTPARRHACYLPCWPGQGVTHINALQLKKDDQRRCLATERREHIKLMSLIGGYLHSEPSELGDASSRHYSTCHTAFQALKYRNH